VCMSMVMMIQMCMLVMVVMVIVFHMLEIVRSVKSFKVCNFFWRESQAHWNWSYFSKCLFTFCSFCWSISISSCSISCF
jgi:hypothetical protein